MMMSEPDRDLHPRPPGSTELQLPDEKVTACPRHTGPLTQDYTRFSVAATWRALKVDL